MAGGRCWKGSTPFQRKDFRRQMGKRKGWQSSQRRQSRPKIMGSEAKLAGMRRQTLLVARRMLKRMRARRQLGEEQDNNEKEVTQ